MTPAHILECFGKQHFTIWAETKGSPRIVPDLTNSNYESQSSTLTAGYSISGSFLGKAVPLQTSHTQTGAPFDLYSAFVCRNETASASIYTYWQARTEKQYETPTQS